MSDLTVEKRHVRQRTTSGRKALPKSTLKVEYATIDASGEIQTPLAPTPPSSLFRSFAGDAVRHASIAVLGGASRTLNLTDSSPLRPFRSALEADSLKLALHKEQQAHGFRIPDFDSSVDALFIAIFTDVVLIVLLLMAFEVLMKFPWASRYLAPRLMERSLLPPSSATATDVLLEDEATSMPVGFFGWLRKVRRDLQRPDEDVLEPDALMMIRFCEFGFKVMSLGTILSAIAIPIYATGNNHADGLNRYSLMNIDRNINEDYGRLLCVVALSYMLLGIMMHYILKEWDGFLELRRQHFLRSVTGVHGNVPAQTRRSVVVELIPSNSRSPAAVRTFFENIFGSSSVFSCVLQGDTSELYRIRDEPDEPSSPGGSCKSVGGDPHAAAADPDLSPHAKTKAAVAAAAAAGLATAGDGLKGAAQLLQEVTIGSAATSTSFVTFRSVEKCVQAQQAILSYGGQWRVCAAPEPRDLIWRNVSASFASVRVRNVLAVGVTAIGALFWAIPVSLIQAWSNLSALGETFPGILHMIEMHPVLYGYLTHYLPVVALIGLQALLPPAFQFVATFYEGHKTKSGVARVVLNRNVAYQCATIYVTVLSGSLWQSLAEIMKSPNLVFHLMATTFPAVGVYFMCLVMTQTALLPLYLLGPIAGAFRANSISERPEPIACQFGKEVTNLAMVLVIGLTYSFVAPLILPMCAVYFGVASLVYRWLFTNVYVSEFDSHGSMWYDMYNSFSLGLIMGTTLMTGLVGVAFDTTTSYIVPLGLPLSAVAFFCYCWHQYGEASRYVPLSDAVEADKQSMDISMSANFYLDPAIKTLDATSVN